MSIFIECSKTDKYRDGAWVVIAKLGSILCPVENVRKLIRWGNLSGDDYLLCNICLTKCSYKVRKSNEKMSCSNLRDLFIEALAPHSNSPSSVIAAFYGIEWVHDLYGIVSPTISNLYIIIWSLTFWKPQKDFFLHIR